MTRETWIFSDKYSILPELVGAVQSIGPVAAIIVGEHKLAEDAFKWGVHKVYWLGSLKQGWMVEDCAPSLAALAENQKPALILIASTRTGKAIAGRLAANLGTSALTDILDLEQDGDAFIARHMIFGGGAIRKDRIKSSTAVVTANPGVFSPVPTASGQPGEINEVKLVEPAWHVTVRERRPLQKTAVNLHAARRVVTAGRGISQKEDLEIIETLAGLLGAEVACTRPLAEGLDWLPRERYIGISGANIRPDLYFGVGVSGQVQHMIGMHDTRVVVAVNKDRNAPIFSQSDYGIPLDLYAFIPAFIKALQAQK